MKLRIRGNSLRLRVTQSEVARLLAGEAIEETIQFSMDAEAKLTYALKHAPSGQEARVDYSAQRITVVLSSDAMRHWASTAAVGVYASSETIAGPLGLLIEKDFACLDADIPEDDDAFPNPNAGSVC